MWKKFFFLLFCFVLVFCIYEESNAWPFRRRRSRSYSSVSYSVNIGTTYQARAQYKANLMAKQRRMSHNVSAVIGGFEGIGMGTSRNCSTCVPRGRMTLVADAAAQSSNGMWYRVRVWR